MSGEPHCGSCTVRIFLHFAPCTVRTPPPFCSICRNCCSLRIMYGKNRSRFAQFCGNKKSLFAPSAVSSMPDILSCSHSRACVRACVCACVCRVYSWVYVYVRACVYVLVCIGIFFQPYLERQTAPSQETVDVAGKGHHPEVDGERLARHR